jgi:DNA-binding CsgD family transcriptional regulator
MTIQLITFFGALIALTTLIVFYKSFTRLIRTPGFLVVAVLLATFGTILLGLPHLNDSIPGYLSLIGNMLAALGSGCILALIGEGYSCIPDVKVQRVITLFAIAGAFLLFLIFLPLSKGLALALAAVFPIVAVVCLGRLLLGNRKGLQKAQLARKASSRLDAYPSSSNASKSGLKRLLLYIVVLSVPLTFLRKILMSAAGPLPFNDWVSLYAMTFLIICGVFILEVLFKKRSVSVVSIAIVILVSTALLLFFFFEVDAMVPSTLINTGYALFVASFYCYLGSFIISSKRPAFRIFALGCAANTFGLTIGWALGFLVEKQFVATTAEVLMIVLIYVIFFASVFALPTFRTNFFSDNLERATESSGTDTGFITGLQDRCAVVAQTYALSAREEEILILLIRGKSLRLIADEYTLSQNTLKTHVNHIHKKLDVHTREELLQRVEDAVIDS